MKRNTKIALVMMALSAMAMGSTSAFAHGGHGMWQQNAAPLTSETNRQRGRKSIMTFTLKAAHCNSNW